MAPYRRHRRSSTLHSPRPIVAFLLVASFGILFVGCGQPDMQGQQPEEFTFTADDIARSRELARGNAGDTAVPALEPYLQGDDAEFDTDVPVLDLTMVKSYDAVRSGPTATGEDLYRVTNEFLNVRSSPNVTAASADRLVRGDIVSVLDFVDAAWAHVRLPGGREGYVAQRYIAKLTSESRLAEEKERFKDLYFINFGFLNVRKAPDTNSDKIGELSGQSFVRILHKDNVWARIPFEGGEGYVAVEYLAPFLPNFLVRQEEFTLPILHYRFSQEELLDTFPIHVDRLQKAGFKLITLRDFRELLLRQEERDVRLDPQQVVIAVSGVTADNMKDVSDVLRATNVRVTLFLETKHIGLDGITEKTLLTLSANGHDLQSAGHTGDDLRSLTNAQVELELKQSRAILEQKTGKPVFAIAYPLGGVNDRIASKAQEAGYLLGLGAIQERAFRREQLLNLPSFSVTVSASGDDVVGLVTGE